MTPPRRLTDATLGDWVNERLRPRGSGGVPAGAVVPSGFARVVRVLHPAGDGRTWGEVAASAGREVHPLVQWCGIAPHLDGAGRSSHVDPEEGSAPAATLEAVLGHCPATGEVTYAVWDGFGSWVDRADGPAVMRGFGGRDYRLFADRKAAHTTWPGMDPFWPQSANLIWPSDRSWCVATEIDWDSTLVACADTVAEALLAEVRLETVEVGYDDDLSWCGDAVNPRPSWLRC